MTRAQEAEIDRLRADGLSISQIADRTGITRSMVGDRVRPHFCACGNRRQRVSELCRACRTAANRKRHDRRLEFVAGLYNDGVPMREIAAALGRSVEGLTPGEASTRAAPELVEARRRGLIGYRVPEGDVRRAA